MGVRSRTIILIAATGAILLMVLIGASILVGDRVADGIDRAQAVSALGQARAALRFDGDMLGSTVVDWAAWDDTYRFVRDRNKAYVQSNLLDSSLSNLGLEFMVFLDRSGNVAYSKAIDPRTGRAASLPRGITRYLEGKLAGIRMPRPGNGGAGLLGLPESVFAVAVGPITTSDNKAPPDGTLLIGYQLDAKKAADLQRLTTHPTMLLPAAAFSRMSRTATAALEPSTGGTADLVVVHGANTLAGYSVVAGIDGTSGVTLGVTTPRAAFSATRSAVIIAGGVLGLLGIAFVAIFAVALDNMVLSRLVRLSSAVSRIGKSGDLKARLPFSGSDEVSALASNINGMLGELGRSQEDLRESEAKYRNLFGNAEVGIFRSRADGSEVIEVNRKFLDIVGMTLEETVGKPSVNLWADPKEREEMTNRLEADGIVLGFECGMANKRRGEVRDCLTSLRLYREEGILEGSVLDITERKQAERELQRLNETLEERVAERTKELAATNEALVESNEARSRFLRSMSHELRTPLNSIIGFTSLLAEGIPGEVNEEQGRQLAMISTSGRHLLALINDVLDLSRIEAGKVEIHSEPIDPSQLLEGLVASMSPAAEAKGLVLELDVSDPALSLTSDRMKVKQILLNLLSNAIKFTDAGSVTLRAFKPSPHLVAFSVTDTGPGIAPEARGRIFGEFEQAGDQAPRTEGTGLGLAISRGLAGSLGGTIGLETEVGKGSTFTLTLPGQPCKAAEAT